VKEYELYLPLRYNDGSPVEDLKIKEVGELLLQQFGGFTFFPQPNQGTWQTANVIYHDEIVIFRVLTGKVRSPRQFFRRLKSDSKREYTTHKVSSCTASAGPGIISFAALLKLGQWMEALALVKGSRCEPSPQSPPAPNGAPPAVDSRAPGVARAPAPATPAACSRRQSTAVPKAHGRSRKGGVS
jgi:hypothetical protein